jgi:hypothetical protein
MHKTLTVGLTALGLATVSMGSLAGTVMAPASATDISTYTVMLPHQQAGWHIALEGLYLVPTSNNLSYAFIEHDLPNDGITYSYRDEISAIDTHFHTGFGVEVGRHFAGNGTDLTVRYERFHSTNQDTVSVKNGGYIDSIYPLWDINWDAGSYDYPNYNYATARYGVKLDIADIMLGQLVLIGDRLNMHLSAGLRYAHLKNEYNATFIDDPSVDYNATQHLGISFDDVFQGIGPRLAVKGDYCVYKNLHLLAQGGSSLVVGTMKFNYIQDWAYSTVSQLYKENRDFLQKRHHQVVPELDARLGLAYTSNASKGLYWSLEAGWKTATYFDAQYMVITGENPYSIFMGQNSNLSFQGPYVSLLLHS